MADCFLIASAIWWMGTFLIHGQWKELWNCVEKKDWLLVVFVLFTIVVNGIRYIQYGDKRFIVSSMYLVFCTIVVIVFRNYLKDNNIVEE